MTTCTLAAVWRAGWVRSIPAAAALPLVDGIAFRQRVEDGTDSIPWEQMVSILTKVRLHHVPSGGMAPSNRVPGSFRSGAITTHGGSLVITVWVELKG